MALVYIIEFPNNKKYIGVHKTLNLDDGYKCCAKHKVNIPLYNAINKYGWNNIIWNIFIDNVSIDKAKLIEVDLIKEYKTQNRNYGYNITEGGDLSRHNLKHTKQTKEKIGIKTKLRTQGKDNPFYNKTHSLESIEKMKLNRKGLASGINHPNCKISPEQIIEIKYKYSNGISKNQLAKEYNVLPITIHRKLKII